MGTVEIVPVMLCPDCALIIANDDDSGIEDPTAHRAAMAAVHGSWVTEYPDTADIRWTVGEDEHAFRTSACDSCGSTLAGARLDGTVVVSLPAPVHELDPRTTTDTAAITCSACRDAL